MRFWTMLVSLVVVGVLASSLFAQDAPKKGRGRGMPAWKDLVGDKTQLDKPTFVTAVTAKAPDDKKDAAKTRAEGMWTRLAVAAGADKDKADDYVFKSEDDFKAAADKVRASFKGKGKKKSDDSTK